MNCAVCREEARAHIYYCAKCAVYVHEKCCQKHVAMVHKKGIEPVSRLLYRGTR